MIPPLNTPARPTNVPVRRKWSYADCGALDIVIEVADAVALDDAINTKSPTFTVFDSHAIPNGAVDLAVRI